MCIHLYDTLIAYEPWDEEMKIKQTYPEHVKFLNVKNNFLSTIAKLLLCNRGILGDCKRKILIVVAIWNVSYVTM